MPSFSDRMRALGLAAGLVGWSATAGLQIPGRRAPLAQAGLFTTLGYVTGTPMGVYGPQLRAGIKLGVAAAAVVATGVAVGTLIPPVRDAMGRRQLPRHAWKWLVVEIPLGTVWAEETAYRGVLGAMAAEAFGTQVGRLVQASAFGLSHIIDARATGEPVVGTVLVTGAAGWLFALLAERSGSLVAPALAHLAINEAGAVAALLVQRQCGA